MPEYLAPGVFIEEVPSGNRPIEGVSTSTAGMVGVTERGPVNDPTLVTSFGDFTRRFGGLLDHRQFTNERDALPYAVQGFFENGGKRVYVTRVVGENATFAEVVLYGSRGENPVDTALSARVAEGDDTLLIDDGANITAGDELLLSDGPRSEYVTVQNAPVQVGIRLRGRFHFDHADGEAVVLQDPPVVDADLSGGVTGDMAAGGGLALDAATVAGLAQGNVLRIGNGADPSRTELVTIAADASADLVEGGLLHDHPQADTTVERVTLADSATNTVLDGAVTAGAVMAALASTAGLAADQVVRVGAGAQRELQVIRNVVSSLSIATTPTASIHAAGTAVVGQVRLLGVHARHPGQWGNRVRIRIRTAHLLETSVATDAAANDTPIRLDATFGLGAGSVLEVRRGDPLAAVLRQRVATVATATNEVELAGGVAAALQEDDAASSLEFDLIVQRVDAAGKVVEDELFTNLGIDPSHARYAPRIVGVFDRNSGEPEEAGASDLIRLSDLTRDAAGADVADAAARRLTVPFDGVDRRMQGGDDDLATIDADAYIGEDADDPDDRSGIHALTRIDEVSIVAVPGRTEQDVQNALINHCARMRYRFAVLDAANAARLREVQAQRQLYDTTYAALYHPWLVVADRFGRPDDVRHIPPSGHVCGVYARTDVERGVHKAPANVDLRGIRDLQVRLTQGEQEVLNPRHVNCLRDFREINRGLRVWGARTLSSDGEWKYVNVRRLFLFVEKSIERGTQFAVFEPNAEPLWATIRRSVGNFLLAVWRDGALEGLKPEEAFFVKVDRTTMTQNDIDNGRLIILVGIAPVKPAEFVIFRISQKTREATA